VSTADRYRRFAEQEAHGWSPCYEEWALGVAGDLELRTLLDELPEPKRQPNLLFTAARYVGIPPARLTASGQRSWRGGPRCATSC
jgi:hypothetical protein